MSIYDVAKKAGVSIATVSRVLNGGNVRESTRRKVEDVMREMNFHPNEMARDLSSGSVRNIAYFVPDIENPFFGKVIHGLSNTARKFGYNIFTIGTDENTDIEHAELRALRNGTLRGIIISPVSSADTETREALLRFQDSGIPVVLIDRDINGADFDGVFSDDEIGSFRAVDLLIKEGHTRIAMITGPETSRPGFERIRGYRRALETSHLSVDKRYMICGNFKIDESCAAMEKLMSLDEPPTAVFTTNNLTTLGVLKYMKEHGLRLGRDLSLTAFDDIPEVVYAGVPLTAVSRDLVKMGTEAMQILRRRFSEKDGEDSSDRLVYKCYVKTELIRRGSEKVLRDNPQD